MKSQEVFDVLRIIFGIFAVIMSILYYSGIYFAIFDEEAEQRAKQSFGGFKGRKAM